MDGPDSVVVHRPSKGIVSLNKVDASNGDVQPKIGKKHSFLHKMLSKILLPGVESRNKMNDTEFLEAIHKLNHFCDIVELILCGLVDYIGEFRNKNHRYTEYDEAAGEIEDDIPCAFLDRAQYPVFSYLYKESFQFYDKFKHETYSMVYSLNPKDIITEELMNRALFHLKEAEKESILEIKRFYARALTLSICLEKFNFFNTLQNMQISPYFSRSLLLFKKETIEKKLEENYYLETEEKAQLKKWTKQLIDFVDTTSPIIMKHKIMPTVQSNFYILSTNCLYESSNEDWYGKHDTIDLTNFGHCFHKYIKKPAIGWTILHELAFFGNITENVLNKQKALINAMDYRGYTPIFYTTFFDHIESFKLIWKHHLCRKNQISFQGETILIVALKHRAIKCIEFLLNRQNHSHDIDVIKSMVSLADSDQNLPLHILLTFNSIHWVLDKLILDPTFQVLQQWTTPMNLVLGNLDGWLPFQLALVLREKICTPEVQAQIVERCLKIVTADKYSDEIVEKMLLSGIDVTKKYVAADLYTTMNKIWENNNAMHLAAASKNSYRLLILLLKYAAKHKISRCIQDQENDSKMKPIDVAVRHASIETIKLLLKHFVFYNYNYRDIFSDVEQIDIKCDCYKYKKRARFPSGQLLEILSRPYPIKEEILKIMLETVYIPLDYNSYDSEKTAFDQAAENLNRECIQMFLDHKDWRNVMIRRTFHKESNSPFIAILQSMPEFLPKIFDKCIVRCEECKDTVYDFSLFEDMFVTKRPYLRATKGGISCSPFYGIYQKPHWLPVYNLCIEHVANEINIKNTPRICDFCIQRNQCSMCDKNAIEWDPSKILNDHQKEYLNTEQRESLAKAEFEYIPTHRDKTRCGELRQNHEIAYVPYRENALKKLAESARENETPLFSTILDHELCSSYVNYKWNKFSSWIYYFLVVGCNLIHAGYLTVTNYTIGPIYEQNETTTKVVKEGDEGICLFDKNSFFLLMANFCGVLMTFLIITKIYYNPKLSLANFGHFIKGLFYLLFLPIFTYYCEDLDTNLQRNLFIIINFISWMLFLYCARIVPFIGLGIIVVHSMIMKFFKFLLAVLLFFTPFDAAFYIMEPDWPSVLKIFAGGVKNSSAKTLFDNYKYMGLILMFYIIVCLAVTDMNEAIKIAKRNQLCLRIKTILWVERCIPLFLKRRITRGLLKKKNQPTQISTYIFFFVIILPFCFIGFLFKQVF